jgi:hypothetical protein
VTQEEARVILNASAFDNVSVSVEHVLFQEKQWVASAKMIPKVIYKRMGRLELLHRASVVLGVSGPSLQSAFEIPELSDIVVERYNEYQKAVNQFKLMVFQAENFEEISVNVSGWLELFRIYASVWPQFENSEKVKLSDELDPVLFYGELRMLSEKGICTFEELLLSEDKIGTEVKKESNRLNLLYRSFGDGSGIEKS